MKKTIILIVGILLTGCDYDRSYKMNDSCKSIEKEATSYRFDSGSAHRTIDFFFDRERLNGEKENVIFFKGSTLNSGKGMFSRRDVKKLYIDEDDYLIIDFKNGKHKLIGEVRKDCLASLESNIKKYLNN